MSEFKDVSSFYNTHKELDNYGHTDMNDPLWYTKQTSSIQKYEHITVQNSEWYLEQSIKMPPTNHAYYECYQPIYNVVHTFVNKNIARMIEAGNFQAAITALGGKGTTNVIDLIKKNKEKSIKKIEKQIEIYDIDEKDTNDLVNMKIRIITQIEELDDKYNEMLSGECVICYDPISSPVMEPGCQNIFCSKCLLNWLANHATCPMCRGEVVLNELVYIDRDECKSEEVKEETPPTKQDHIINIIKKSGKVLIYSEYDKSFKTIKKVLKEHDIKYGELKLTCIDDVLDSYKNGDTNILLLNGRRHAAGLNLENTTDIILFHKMDDGLVTQIVGRANRIGRTESVTVHHLI